MTNEPLTLAMVTATLEPTRMALHAAANRYGRHTPEYSRLMLLAVDITVAEQSVRDAVNAGEVALLLEPFPAVGAVATATTTVEQIA